MRNSALALAVVACLAAIPGNSPAAPAKRPRIEIKPASPAATPDFRWVFTITVYNDGATGLYPDSIHATAEDLDPGKVDGPRQQVIPLSHFTRILRPISAGESQTFNYAGNAYYERSKVTMRLYSHTSDGKKQQTETTAEIRPGPSSETYASSTFEIQGRKVEYVYVRGARPPAPWPGLLLVHGERGNARRLLPFARQAAVTGYSVVLVSLPGYGASDGESDLMGPASAAAVEKAYEILRSQPDVDSSKVSAWGVSLGAGLVARFATRHPELKAVVLQGGLYDLWAVARVRGAEGTREIVRVAGSDSAAWRERSALLSATKIPSPVLILHEERDAAAPLYQARTYADVLRQGGGTVEIASPDGADRPRPIGTTAESGLDFIERKVGIRKL